MSARQLAILFVAILTFLAACGSTSEPRESSEPAEVGDLDMALVLNVREWAEGEPIPVDFTCDGSDRSPEATLTAVPEGTRSFALIVDDPDAGAQPFVHWVVYDIDVTTREIGDDEPRFSYGPNDFGVSRWSGPCPPEGDGVHTYRWRLLALDENLELGPDLDGRALETAIADHVLGTAVFTGTFER